MTQRTAARTRLRALDGLRALAVFGVVASHLHLRGMEVGGLGVDVFFVISGFVITLGLVRELEGRGVVDFAAFYVRRARRLFPALGIFLAVTIAWALLAASMHERHVTFTALPFVVLYVANWRSAAHGGLGVYAHTWSLAIEEQFYFLWPAFIAFGVRRWSKRGVVVALLALIGAVMVIRPLTAALIHAEFGRYAFTSRLDEPAIGGLAAVLFVWAEPQLRARLPLLRLLAIALPAVVVGLGVIESHHVRLHGHADLVQDLMILGVYDILGVAAAGLILYLALVEESAVSALLGHPVLVALGRVSYGIYLWDYGLIVMTRHSLPAVAHIAAVVAIAFVSYELVERRVNPHAPAPFG